MSHPVGFKEWQVVCDALASGRQSIILRKGGIHEGRQGFSFASESFFLFPTRFHSQGENVREGDVKVMPEWQPGDELYVTHHAEALWAVTLTDWQAVAALEPFHIYTEATIRDRFDWQGKGMASGSIHVALVRVRELAQPWKLQYQTSFGGCRSWITLSEPPANWESNALPALNDEAFDSLQSQLATIL